MSKLSFRSDCNTAAAVMLVFALLANVPFTYGLLLHDHGDDGVHAHAVTVDDMREVDLQAVLHHHHDIHENSRDDSDNDSDGGEYADSVFIFLNAPATALSIHGSSRTAVASIRNISSRVLPRSMLPCETTDAARISVAPWPSAHALRPAHALDALLQTSRALLL